ncbi:GNAT family N-acetyltransferase [Aquimarina pacifica]|uniref:GNAT family N-acetyltransferase n=1 Tax=Aquimarina pacifica TaxID=1296415 RepID=UPI00046F1D18|nr:GNAT family N-acetyltransferase [Aquimarina pacifica]
MNTLIETKRLVLREITFDDKEELFLLHSDPKVQKWTGEPVIKSMKEVEQSIAIRLKDYREYGFGRLAVIQKETSKFIGWAGLTYLPEFDKVDIGYRLKKKFWGMGYATEASKAIIDYGFKVLNLDLIIAIALPENKTSIRVMEKIGMVYDKKAPYDEIIQEAIWYKLERETYNQK